MENKRIHWIDLCKTLGLLLVVLGHGHLLPNSWQQLIYSFHMPLFFILSGLLYKYKSLKENLLHDFASLLKPYLIISLICFLIQCGILYSQNTLNSHSCYVRLVGILVVACHTGQYPPASDPTWFIISLFFSRMIISMHNSKAYRYLLLVLSMFLFLLMKRKGIDTWLPFDSALMSLPFMVFGIHLSPFIKKEVTLKVKNCIAVLSIGAIIVLYVANQYNGLVDMCWTSYGKDILLFYFNGFLGSMILISLCKITPPHPYVHKYVCNNIKRRLISDWV